MTEDLISEFVAEATDHLTRAEEILLGLGHQPDQVDPEAVNACFRALHTIKGCSGFLDIPRVQHLSHAGEQILDALRTRELAGSAAVFDTLLLTVSRLQALIAQLSGQQVAIPATDDDCIGQLESLRTAASPASLPAHPPIVATVRSAQAAVAGPGAITGAALLDGIGTAIAELIVAGHGDPAEVAGILDRLAHSMLSGPWSPEARPVMTRMRQLLDGLSGPDAQAIFLQLIKLCEQLESIQRCYQAPVAGADPATVVPSAASPVAESAASAPAAPAVLAPAAEGSAMDEFLVEATELLNHAEATVLGKSAFTRDEVNGVFRAFHTVKGMAAYLDLPVVERSAHGFEAKIQAVRDGTAAADEAFAATVLSGVDALREQLGLVKRRLHTAVATSETTAGGAPAASAEDRPGERLGDLLADFGVSRQAIEHSAATVKPGERIGDKLVADGAATRQQVEKAAQVQQALKVAGDAFSRVATAKLEELMNQVGELLIAQAMVQHNPELPPNSQLAQAVGRQGRILRNLQVLSLSLRMVPLRGTFQKMARVVYDTAKKLGKQVDFSLGGEDTEIDRTMAETMGDPLMHMVRNGIDHGIEMPDVRTRNGKPAAGKLRLEAFQAGDDVVIRLVDDGAGMDPQRLRAKAIEKGLIDPSQPMDEQACFQIIFLPGFSTAAKVTDVSGRGVGMDVVRRQVEEAKGTVHIDSVVGKGTTFTIRLPMTTAILDAMQLQVGGENLLMPISGIVEMLRPGPGQVQTVLDRGQMIQHRNRTLPLIRLGEVLGIPGGESDPGKSILVVIDNRGCDYVIQVDAILGQRQVVIKPFDAGVVHHPGTSGTTILGDGRVALILNPAFLVRSQAANAA
ncbi:hypothetical protein LBMAG53_18360 [Planctomycetota bacterium]|nr:hypothetical protein LBMAG53_18360 [Planctomycetota bacterium]